MIINEDDYLAHYGTPRHSGRYPWGTSGWGNGTPDHYIPRDNASFSDFVAKLRSQGLSEKEIREGFGMSSVEFRAVRSRVNAEIVADQTRKIEALRAKGVGTTEIGRRLGIPEGTVRLRLKNKDQLKVDKIQQIANLLRKEVEGREMIMIGEGVDTMLGVSRERLETAVTMLKQEGYKVHSGIQVPQIGAPGNYTTLKVLTKPEIEWAQVVKNKDKIQLINEHLSDDGRGSFGTFPPIPVDLRRVGVVYGSEGGAAKDGLMYIRPGKEDLSLGNSSYAQVRIQVGKGHYLKGMAVYSDKLPPGVDILFHTNKESTGNKLDALKKLEDDPQRPFKTTIRKQVTKIGPDGKEYNASAVNLVNWEGEWGNWSKTIASQVLSKQDLKLAKEQLKMVQEAKKNQFEEIMSLTNPVVREKLLKEFSDSADAAAVHLKAAMLPRQSWNTILPINSLKDSEVYAPNYKNGETVALIRYPHGGTFEIPNLVVNNKNREALSVMKNARDAVGINAKVAERLSGADFDGDTVLVIPNNDGRVKSTAALEGLKNFNPRETYRAYPGMKKMTEVTKQNEMGKISNLITDMTIKGASTSDLVRAVKHSMVVIDAEKHNLNYKQSEIDNGIKALKAKYQTDLETGHVGGASTIVSRAKSKVFAPETKLRKHADGGPIDRETGELVYVPTGRTNFKTGALVTPSRKRLEVAKDARELSSGTPMENLYANHSNALKAMANKARLEMLRQETPRLSTSARRVYAKQVKSLDEKLTAIELNAPLERRAQALANTVVAAKKQADPNMDKSTLRKISYAALEDARSRTGASKTKIVITPDEWEAIQANAIGGHKLKKILISADMDVVKELATPKQRKLMTSTKMNRAKAMASAGYTDAQIAEQLGVSISTLHESMGALRDG